MVDLPHATGSWPPGLPTVLQLPKVHNGPLPPAWADDDVRLSEALVGELVSRLSEPGDVVFDPFAGFGTTLAVAERLGRQGWGLELDPERAAFARAGLAAPERLITGDARRLGEYAIPPVRLSLTSPPYSSPGESHAALSAYREPQPRLCRLSGRAGRRVPRARERFCSRTAGR